VSLALKISHPTGLNFGDCFAYALVRDRSKPLVYKGTYFGAPNTMSAFR
jgi:ribonuclease VapC